MVQQPSVRQKLTILEDDLRNKDEPKNEDDLKILTTIKVTKIQSIVTHFLHL